MPYAEPPQSTSEKAPLGAQYEKVKSFLSELLFPLSGGSAVIGAGLGYLAYVVYCARINYMPSLDIQENLGLFLGLTLLGITIIPLVILLPFLPGILLQLLLSPNRNGEEPFSPRAIKRTALWLFLPSFLFALGASWVDALEKGETDVRLPNTEWMMSAIMIWALIVPVAAAIYYAARDKYRGQGFWEGAIQSIKASFPVFLTSIASAVIMSGYVPIIKLMGGPTGADGFSLRFIFFLIFTVVLISTGNAMLAGARHRKEFTATALVIGTYFVFSFFLTVGPMSGVLMNKLGRGNLGPIEITVAEADLSRIPQDIRDELDTRSDLTTHTYAVRGLYLQLHIGSEFRVGVPREIQKQKSRHNPITSSWSIPETAILTWRTIDFFQIQFPKEGEKIEALTEHMP